MKTTKSSIIMKVLLNKFHPKNGDSLTNFLSADQKERISALETDSQDLAPALYWPIEAVKKVHYSWLLEAVSKTPDWIRPLLIYSLGPEQSSGLFKQFKLHAPSARLPSKTKVVLLGQLYKYWSPEDFMPLAYVQPTPLDDLLSLKKRQLVEIINLLSMYDLVHITKKIVDTRLLNKILFCLSAIQQKFLKEIIHQKEKLAFPNLDFHKWDGTPEAFQLLLHKRGLIRFGRALCGQNPHFLWHITHTLDSGRGKAVAKLAKNTDDSKVTPHLIDQALTAVKFIKKATESE